MRDRIRYLRGLRMASILLLFLSHGGCAAGAAPAGNDVQSAVDKTDWSARFTFDGDGKPGPYTVDPHVWVYTGEFAKRFGMPEKWVNDELRGVVAAAWRTTKSGFVVCGWGGKGDVCNEPEAATLELYFDTTTTQLPWAKWSKDMDLVQLGPGVDSIGFLTPQNCEHRREPSEFLTWNKRDPCRIQTVRRQPFADPESDDEIFLFYKSASFSGQGNFKPINAYDKNAYEGLAWLRLSYERPVGMHEEPSAALLMLETRTAPLGKTLKKFHEIYLPTEFDQRVKAVLDEKRIMQRQLYKKALGFE